METLRSVSRSALEKLALLLDLTADELIICRDLVISGRAYYEWGTPKAGGGVRDITSPVEELKDVQRRILSRLLYQVTVHTIAHGFVRNRDIMTNAAPHNAARALLNLDLKNAFPSVRTIRVLKNLRAPLRRILRIHFSHSISEDEIEDIFWILMRLCMHRDCLPQGAPTSPALLNVVCLNLDRKLFQLATENGLTVTRYADDISFSTPEDEIAGQLRQKIRSTISNAGWKINQKKTKYLRRCTGNALEITGLLIQENGKTTIPTRRRDKYRGFLRRLLERDELSDGDRAIAIGIVVYVSRVYGGRLPSSIAKHWGRVKDKFGIQDVPKRKCLDINPYMPDLPG